MAYNMAGSIPLHRRKTAKTRCYMDHHKSPFNYLPLNTLYTMALDRGIHSSSWSLHNHCPFTITRLPFWRQRRILLELLHEDEIKKSPYIKYKIPELKRFIKQRKISGGNKIRSKQSCINALTAADKIYTFPFLDLPCELRLNFYKYLLPANGMHPLPPTKSSPVPAEPALFRTCRQIRKESLPIFFKHTRFPIRATVVTSSGQRARALTTPGTEGWLNSVNINNLKLIRHLRFEMVMYKESTGTRPVLSVARDMAWICNIELPRSGSGTSFADLNCTVSADGNHVFTLRGCIINVRSRMRPCMCNACLSPKHTSPLKDSLIDVERAMEKLFVAAKNNAVDVKSVCDFIDEVATTVLRAGVAPLTNSEHLIKDDVGTHYFGRALKLG